MKAAPVMMAPFQEQLRQADGRPYGTAAHRQQIAKVLRS